MLEVHYMMVYVVIYSLWGETKATIIAALMTRIKRIYADFLFACGKSFLATNDTNFHKLKPKLRLS